MDARLPHWVIMVVVWIIVVNLIVWGVSSLLFWLYLITN